MNKIAFMRFIGEILANPQKFKEDFEQLEKTDIDGEIMLKIKLRGSLAEVVRGFNAAD
jgi:hypothetical protein